MVTAADAATLGGADGLLGIAPFGCAREHLYRGFPELPQRISSDHTSGAYFAAGRQASVGSVIAAENIASDGRSSRRSHLRPEELSALNTFNMSATTTLGLLSELHHDHWV
jgi:hypothetical protein